MASDIFNLKSLYLEDTVVRGARISLKNAPTTRIVKVNPEDESVVKTGETGINKEYLIQSSLLGNDLQGYGTFVNNSNIVSGYTGAQNLTYSDKIKLDGDKTYYGISGIEGTNIYLTDRYVKESSADPDVQSGSCSIVKYYLGSEKYESVDQNIVYNKDESQWNVTGMQMSDPIVTPTGIFELDTGVSLQFQKATSSQYPDIATILNVTKTLVDKNTSPLYDVSLSPIPYPHGSLQVYMGISGEVLEKAEENKEYIINYSNGSEIIYPIPPYEEREVAYIKFLDYMDNEEQIIIDSAFDGNLILNKKIVENEVEITKPVNGIIPTDDFSIKVGENTLDKNTNYLVDNDAGLVTFVEHNNSEELIDALVYPKELIWDGISVIKGIKESEVDNFNNLVIPGVSGLEGIDYTIYFEDTDSNNLVKNTDFIIDPESGAFSLINPLKSDEAVLASYYVEGEDIDDEVIDLDQMQLKSFPLIVNSLVITKKYSVINDDGIIETKTRILVEGTDYTIYYVTGFIVLYPGDETTVELRASYTPMTQINCVVQSISNSTDNLFTIIDDVLSYTQDDVENEGLVFVVDNPVVSVPEKIVFDEDKVDSNYTFSGSLSPEDFIEVKTKDNLKVFNITGLGYDNLKREISLDQTYNEVYPEDGDIVVSTYKFTSSILPYAPVLLIYTVINTGDTSFVIEGYDRTNLLMSGSILRIDNKDPQSSTYYTIKSAIYENQNTTVNIYGTFSEDIIDPTFYIFDEALSWLSFSDDVIVDTTIPIDSESLVLNGGSLFVSTNVKKDALLLLNNQDIYTVTSITVVGEESTIGIYPSLKDAPITNIKYTRLPIYDIGITTLPAQKLIIDDVEEPAFTLWYQSPEGFEGSAMVLFIGGKLIIEEYVSGVKNPVSYEYLISDYSDIYAFAKTIQNTSSTFRVNVPYMDVPDYNPFTIEHSGEEQYYLGTGTWNPETLINFEEESYVNLPYTFSIIPALIKYTLIEVFGGKNDFTVQNVDVTNLFLPGNVLSFINSINGDYFFTTVISSEYVSENTVINISSLITEDMVSPSLYRYDAVTWEILYSSLSSIDYDNSIFTFSGSLTQGISVGTLLFISDAYVYQVSSISIGTGNYQITVNSSISTIIVIETYTGFVKFSKVPVIVGSGDSFIDMGILNTQKMEIDTDYTIENGIIELVVGVSSLERYQLSYMGLDNRYEDENENIKCSCRFLSSLPEGYRLDVYLEYQNIDQFYIQKLTERNFSEIVVVPQIENIIEQKGSGGGQGSDNGANSDAVTNYNGGIADLSYMLHDEYIKKQLFLRFYHWYKDRLRGLSGEMQLGLGFKFAHSNAVGLNGTAYSLDDQYVETEDYTLTTDSEIEQIENGYSKFFPIGYNGQAPDYYHRFKKECLSFNDVYCCNIRYKDNTNTVQTIGVIKSNQPYWSRTSDLNYYVWYNVEDNLVGDYEVEVPEADLVFTPSNYSFLKVIEIGDRIKVDTFKNYYEISNIVAPDNRAYEYIVLSTTFTEKGIKTYDIVDEEDIELDNLLDNLPPDGYRIWINRQNKENFPMSDDYGNLGATAYSESIEGLVRNTRRIRKPFLLDLLKLFFPLLDTLEPTTNFTIMVKEDSEASWKELGSIDLSKLSFKEERNVDDVLDALRYNFTEKYIVPSVPPYTVYDIKETDDEGFYRYFYLSLEKVYDSDSEEGYYQSIVLRAKNRNWYFKIVNGGEEDIIEDYGFSASKEYKNFYDSENIYRKLLLEKQAWQTEELIVRDLYDYSDKIARAFNQGNLNRENNQYQDYLVMPDGGTTSGISDILRTRIVSYQKQISFLASTEGPVYRVLYPDMVHAEDSASSEIALTYTQTLYAWNLYNTFYSKMLFYYQLNEDNNDAWKNNYVRWVMSLEEGIIPQKLARQMFNENNGIITFKLYELSIINLKLYSTLVDSAYVTISSTYTGKYLQIIFNIGTAINTFSTNLYTIKVIGNASNVVYKSIDELCLEINSYTYGSNRIFSALNIYEHYENNIVSNTCLISNQIIDPINGLDIDATNVADHSSSDPRILFLNKNIEDRMYTHEIRELPGFSISYLGNYYLLKYGQIGLTVSVNYGYDYTDLKYGVFMGESGTRILSLSFLFDGTTTYRTFELYSITNSRYKTLSELSVEIQESGEFSCVVPSTYSSTSCDYMIVTTMYIDGDDNTVSVYITTNVVYSNLDDGVNQFYYKLYRDSDGITQLDIVFYSLIVNGSLIYKSTTILDTFTFSFQKSDDSFKTLSEFCAELSAFKFQGEPIISAASVYEYDPGSDLSTTFVVLNQNLEAVGYDWITSIYVDTYSITLSNTGTNVIPEAKNAVFSFPMYTANGNVAKQPIEGIPVSGAWSEDTSGNVLEISCIDGDEWSITFTDYDAGDYKSYMVPSTILTAIDSGQTITESQYDQIRVVEDQPQVSVLKELVLNRIGDEDTSIVKYNLRQYGTLNELIEAILATRFNSSGEVDATANRRFFSASLIGDSDIEGMYKSNELYAEYVPIIKSFSVQMDNGNIVYKSRELIGWEIKETTLDVALKFNIKMSAKRYSYNADHTFNVNTPSKAYTDTLYNFPQSFKRDILGFDIYSWDYNASYIVRNNWIYFQSDSVTYVKSGDVGQPDITLGYGIPLAGSGNSLAPDNETLGELITRLNNNAYINRWFYVNLKFTRDNVDNPGYFEYDYLPNHSSDIPKSEFDYIKLKNGPLISLESSGNYTFTSSNITIDSDANELSISCDWEMNHLFTYTFFFNDPSIVTIGDLVNSINATLSEQITSSLIEGFVIGGLSTALCTTLVPTFSTKSFSSGGSFVDQNLPIYVGASTSNALGLRVRAASGSNFTVNNATYLIPRSQDRLTLTCEITYNESYILSGYDISSYSVVLLCYYLSTLKPHTEDIFPYLFSAEPISESFSYFNASILLSTNKEISTDGVDLYGELNNNTAFKVLNMSSEGTLNITEDTIELITTKTYIADIAGEEVSDILDKIHGTYSDGFLSCNVLTIANNEIDRGYLNTGEYSLTSGNTPAHVYLGIMGDIKFIQISDQNLHVQYNYIKERLGMPWRDSSGNLEYDYYTPEMYNENNPCAIDLANFLGYLRTTRYNQIKSSVINEGIISNKYLWLYMKFHKEFGCDQQVNTIKNLIQKNDEDIETLDQIL